MAVRVPAGQKTLSCDADVAGTTSVSLNLQAACLDDRNARFAVAPVERGSSRFPARPWPGWRQVPVMLMGLPGRWRRDRHGGEAGGPPGRYAGLTARAPRPYA